MSAGLTPFHHPTVLKELLLKTPVSIGIDKTKISRQGYLFQKIQ
jgi:hypothetical protein